MAFRKAVAAESFELGERFLRELPLVASVDHPFDQLLLERGDAARELEGGHGLAEHVGLAWREARAFDRDPHGLLLEERHPERLAQHLLKLGLQIVDRLQAFAAAEVGVHHVALDGTGPDDRDLHDEVVVGSRLQPRQHRHLRTAFDLEGA